MKKFALFCCCAVLASFAMAQTSTSPGIDVEIVDPTDGDNGFCVGASETFTAQVWVRPGNGTDSCTQSCGTVTGGSANLATGVIDVAFDDTKLTYQSSAVGTHYPDVLLQDNTGEGRIGGAMAGDWSPDADTTGTLADPCAMAKLTSPGVLFEVTFQTVAGFSGSTDLHLRREGDGFAFSFADGCANVYKAGSGIDEIYDATVGEDIAPTTGDSTFSVAPGDGIIATGTGTADFSMFLSDGSGLPDQQVAVELSNPLAYNVSLGAVSDDGGGNYSATLSAGSDSGRVKARFRADDCAGSFYDDVTHTIYIQDPAYTCLPGDANGSGAGPVNLFDILMIVDEINDGDDNGNPSVWPNNGVPATPCADVNNNGSVNLFDALDAVTLTINAI
jgi:hypothetical protein